jgi:hypothetical protein
MQNQIKKSLPPFKSITSKPILFLDALLGVFVISFLFFFLAGAIYFATHSYEESGLDEIASAFAFLLFLFGFVSFAGLAFYYRKTRYTTTIIDEKGIRYVNKFNGNIVKDLSWDSFAKKENFEYFFETPKYDINSRTPHKSVIDQFSWPVLLENKVVIHTDTFMGKHFFGAFYSNRTELIRAFLLGVVHFRSDLTIDPAIFAAHYINPENFEINYRQRRQIQFFGFLFCVVILVILYFVVN